MTYVSKLAVARAQDLGSGKIRTASYPKMWIRECSKEKGGFTNHVSHQTGLDVDLRLPLLPPDHEKWDFLGSKAYEKSKYDQATAILQLEAINRQHLVDKIFFNDPVCKRLHLCQHQKNHDHHFHVRIRPPARIDGIASVYSLGSKVVKEAYDKMSKVAGGIVDAFEDVYDAVADFVD